MFNLLGWLVNLNVIYSLETKLKLITGVRAIDRSTEAAYHFQNSHKAYSKKKKLNVAGCDLFTRYYAGTANVIVIIIFIIILINDIINIITKKIKLFSELNRQSCAITELG